MICSGRDKIETPDQVEYFFVVWKDICYCFQSLYFVQWVIIYASHVQFKQAEETAKKLDLDGLVVIGGDDSNTNACLLAENFR